MIESPQESQERAFELPIYSSLGVETVVVAQRLGKVWLALPEIAKLAARDLAVRVQKDFEATLQSAKPNAVRIKLVSYPEDGTLSEQLLQRLSGS